MYFVYFVSNVYWIFEPYAGDFYVWMINKVKILINTSAGKTTNSSKLKYRKARRGNNT